MSTFPIRRVDRNRAKAVEPLAEPAHVLVPIEEGRRG